MRKYQDLDTESIVTWLENHKERIAAGINAGQIDRDKAQAFRLELSHR